MNIVEIKDSAKYKHPSKRKIGSMITESGLLIKGGQFNKAISVCDDALKLDPTDSSILTNKGTAYVSLSKFDDAISCFDLALQYDPKLANAWYNKATAKALQNEIPEALSLLEQSIQLDSRYTKMAKTDEDFFYLRNNAKFIELVGS